jgi:hypothetical protein
MVQIMDRTDWTTKYVRELAGMPFDGGVSEGMFAKPKRPERTPPKPRELKITDAEVLLIRSAKEPTKVTAKRYGLTPRYVRHIQTGTSRRAARLLQSCCAT